MSPTVAKPLRWLASIISVLLLLAACGGMWFFWKLRASLPQLDGAAPVPGLTASIAVTRDALGIPTIKGATRTDVARALGFLHAQDRFFQMDTLRRRAAGELAEIVGQPAVSVDRASRLHGFRKLAQTVLQNSSPEVRARLEAYTAGVNAGLAALPAKPFEYVLLRVEPKPWLSEDSFLVSYAMCLELEDSTGTRDRTLMTLRDRLGEAALAFFAPLVGPNDAALDGSTAPAPPLPTARQINLRSRQVDANTAANRRIAATIPPVRARPISEETDLLAAARSSDPELRPGSNSLALAGGRTASGAGLLGNDMHLELRVPNTWYRARLQWPDHELNGATIPGVPLMVVGSNGHVAWGFTAAYTDRTDLIVVQINPSDHAFYLRDNQAVPYEIRRERILVKGSAPVDVEYRWTIWGPIVGQDEKTRPLALHWAAHDPAAINYDFAAMESAATVEDAIQVAHRAGMPALNFTVADAAGNIAWTLVGRQPQRFRYNGRTPTTWYYGDRGWRGFIPPDEVPTVRAKTDGQIWTANNRIMGGAALEKLGDGGYATPPRAVQLRDDLTAVQRAVPADLLRIQLDDRAIFLERWQKKLLAVLTPEAVAGKKSRSELRSLVEHWEGRASVDSASYRLVRAWRTSVAESSLTPIFAACVEKDPAFDWHVFNYENALWTMLQEQPEHLLNPRFDKWDDLLLAAADDVVEKLAQAGTPLGGATWGRRNTARIQHPLAGVLPAWARGWISLPADPLPGDVNMPRVQTPSFGASERMVVSPGHEAEGIFHMPGGQSAHPLSPFFSAGHAAWVKGEATPFLPGKTAHTLTLQSGN